MKRKLWVSVLILLLCGIAVEGQESRVGTMNQGSGVGNRPAIEALSGTGKKDYIAM